MSDTPTFLDDVLHGRRLASEIDSVVKSWHESDSELSLRETLGFREDEYDLWLGSPRFLDLIIFAHSTNTPLVEIANDNFTEKQRIAARSEDIWMVDRLREWLSKNLDQ